MNAQSDVRVTVRVDRGLKEQAERLFLHLGLNMTTALNIFLRKAVDEEAIPFPVSAKSPVLVNGYSAADVTSAFKTAVRNEIADNKKNGFPIARYDVENKQAYLDYADGARKNINA
jgi:addiction module RelB/DinJ family antitoxin